METLAGQAQALGVAAATGALLGFVYDWYRVAREIWCFKRAACALGDATFWLVSTALAFFSLLWGNRGEVRFFVLFGMGLGAAAYFCTLSRPAKRLVRFLIFLLLKTWYLFRKVCFWVWKVMSLPGRIFSLVVNWLVSVLSRWQAKLVQGLKNYFLAAVVKGGRNLFWRLKGIFSRYGAGKR